MVLSSLPDTRQGESKGREAGSLILESCLFRRHSPRCVPRASPEARVHAQGSGLHQVQGAPARPSPPPPALPSQLRLHLEEIAQSIPVGAVDPVIRDEAPGRRGHTGGDRRAGRGRARGHRDFEHLRGGTPEAAAAVAAAAGARSSAARRRLQTPEREVVPFTHTHTPTATASPSALAGVPAAAPFLHAQEGGWAEKGERNWERVWKENPYRRQPD